MTDDTVATFPPVGARPATLPSALPQETAQKPTMTKENRWGLLILAIGAAMLILPTLQGIAQVSWSTEQGAHGPIVLAIAIWLFARRWPVIRANAEPGSAIWGSLAFAVMLLAYTVAKIVGSIVLESAAMYGALVAALYLFVGFRAMREAWFPIAYFLFVLPPPGSVVAAATQPLRLQISEYAVAFLSLFGYPVARSGLMIYVSQYILEVKAACGGLNSMISLSAIGLFYAYIRHNSNIRYCLLFFMVIIFMAIVANFARVLILILITYYLGNGAAQGFLHQFAGMTMFTVAMVGILLFDGAAGPIRRALATKA
ncbi:exosortase [Sphingomonas paeninsulae]|jgi:exosortase|uniref:Exosortase n=1 Tax=Sphingomonas paeninsulae TaxID=2319844 RepID=A0A494TCQ6_SPHPE|nr:exosortase V [Sphingomonas paeninsulae]AYJ86980.1 exosortase [Sphingomonas paeninsulae]